jgi:hypothetical protein
MNTGLPPSREIMRRDHVSQCRGQYSC